jgi:hypothetical protein
MGMRFVPVSDEETVTLPDETSAAGSTIIDSYLRHEMRLRPEDPIYALLNWIRPDEHSMDLYQLPLSRKIRMSHEHFADYLGEGRTSHVLPRKSHWKAKSPLDHKWYVSRHPVNVHIISLHGVPQPILNRNAHIVDTILATAGRSPEGTEKVSCRTIDINTTLQFYRDTIRQEEYLQELSWYTNCAVHKTVVINVLLNVPHNERSFQEIFGQDGASLWLDFKQRYKEISGKEFGPDDETDFIPLWKLTGLSASAIQPLSLGEYNTYQAAIAEKWVDEHTGRRPVEPGMGLAWPLETIVDLISTFMNIYVSFQDVGGIVAAGELIMLRHLLTARLGITEEVYLDLVSPIIVKLLVAHYLMQSIADSSRFGDASAELSTLVKEVEDQYLLGEKPLIEKLIDKCVATAKEEIADLPEEHVSAEGAADWLRKALIPTLDDLRTNIVARNVNTGFFSSPCIVHKISLGIHPKSPFVSIRTVCTAVDQAELSLRSQFLMESGGEYLLSSSAFAESQAVTQEFAHSKEVAPMEDSNVVGGRSNCSGGCSSLSGQLVYALGKIGYDFVSRSRRDSIKQKMDESARPEEPEDLLAYLDANPYDASAVRWTLELDGTPIYIIEPHGAFAREGYDLLRQFLREEISEGVERVSIPGVILGVTSFRSGLELPVVMPEIRGMYSWTTEALVTAVSGPDMGDDEPEEAKKVRRAKREAVTNFLERVYYEIRNLGREPQERALNFAATNAFEVEQIYERAIQEDMELDQINVERSPVGPPGTDCWDVKLMFFFPDRPVQSVRKAYRFTVDVADIVPAIVGPVRSWSIR